MKKKRFSAEQIVGILKQAEVGVPVVSCASAGVNLIAIRVPTTQIKPISRWIRRGLCVIRDSSLVWNEASMSPVTIASCDAAVVKEIVFGCQLQNRACESA